MNTTNAGKRWTKHDDDYLLKNFKNKSIINLAKYFGRTLRSIKCRLMLHAYNDLDHGKYTIDVLCNIYNIPYDEFIIFVENRNKKIKKKILSQITCDKSTQTTCDKGTQTQYLRKIKVD